MTSKFNPDDFLNQPVEGANATTRTPVPESEYMAVVDDFKLRMVDIKKGDNAGKSVLAIDIFWNILDDSVRQLLKREKVTSKQGFFIDIDENGKIAVGEDVNVKLGRVREALNQNDPSQPWMFQMLKGAGPAKIKVKHRPDENDEKIVYDEVVAVTKAA